MEVHKGIVLNIIPSPDTSHYFVPHFGLTVNNEIYRMFADGRIKYGPKKYLHLFSTAVTMDKQRIISNYNVKITTRKNY